MHAAKAATRRQVVPMSDSTITKRALGQAVKALLSARPFSEITVGDICAHCGLSRKTLYYHFEDKYALVNWVFHTELIQPLEARRFDDFWQMLEMVANYMHQNRMFYHHAFKMRGTDRFWDYFSRCLQPHLLKAVRDQLADGRHFSRKEKEAACAEFLADAFVYSIEKWIIHYPQLTPDRYVDLFRLELPKFE